MTKQTKATKATKAVQAMQVQASDYESELLLAYQRQVNAEILQASIEEVNNCVTSQERFLKAINLLCKQDGRFTVKALTYKSKQRNLLFNKQKIMYFTANFVNVTKSQADKHSIKIMSVKRYNHSYCYNIAVEQYQSYDAIKALIQQLAV